MVNCIYGRQSGIVYVNSSNILFEGSKLMEKEKKWWFQETNKAKLLSSFVAIEQGYTNKIFYERLSFDVNQLIYNSQRLIWASIISSFAYQRQIDACC